MPCRTCSISDSLALPTRIFRGQQSCRIMRQLCLVPRGVAVSAVPSWTCAARSAGLIGPVVGAPAVRVPAAPGRPYVVDASAQRRARHGQVQVTFRLRERASGAAYEMTEQAQLEPVVCVLAESAGLARDAADLVEVEYEPLPSVASVEAALQPRAPKDHAELDDNLCYRLQREGGDVDRAFQEAECVVRLRVDNPRVAPVPMEPRGIVVVPEGGALTAWVSSQAPHGVRADLAQAIGLDPASFGWWRPTSAGGSAPRAAPAPSTSWPVTWRCSTIDPSSEWRRAVRTC